MCRGQNVTARGRAADTGIGAGPVIVRSSFLFSSPGIYKSEFRGKLLSLLFFALL